MALPAGGRPFAGSCFAGRNDMAEFLVTLACADPLHLARDIEASRQGGAAGVHIDIMDGQYVPNFCMNFDQAAAIRNAYPDLAMDLHLMVARPEQWLPALERLRPQSVAFHTDATSFSYRLLGQIHRLGAESGIALNPSQPVDIILPLISQLDYVLLMAVEPGFSGQSMLPETVDRIRELVRLRREKQKKWKILLDGGVDFANAPLCAAAGADVLVGGALCCFAQPDVQQACRRLDSVLKAI